MYTVENIMNYTSSREIGEERRTYVEVGPEGNKYYKYDYVKAYVDLIVKQKLEEALTSREEFHKELIAEYHPSPRSGKAGFCFYLSISTEEEWLSTEVEIELSVYLLDMGEHFLFAKNLSKDELGEQTSKIINDFINFITENKIRKYSIP